MIEIDLLEKIYRNPREAKEGLKELIEDLLEVDSRVVSVAAGQRGWSRVTIEGAEENVAASYLRSVLGTKSSIADIEEGQVRKGKLIDLGRVGYGIYVDIGVTNKEGGFVDALVPAFSLKKHLGVRGSMSVRRLSAATGLLENLPLDVRVFRLDVARGEIEARLTNSQARRLGRGRNRFYVCGETRRKIKNAIARTGNSGSVVRIKRLGLLENQVQCSKDADPHEIVRQIGPLLNAEIAVPRGL